MSDAPVRSADGQGPFAAADVAGETGTVSAELDENEFLQGVLRVAGSNTLWYVPVRFIPALTALLTVPVFTATFSKEEYGAFYLLSSVAALAANISTAWITSSTGRFFWSSKRDRRMDEFTATVLWAATVSLVVTAAVLVVAAWFLRNSLDPLLPRLVPSAAAYFVFNFLANALVQILRAGNLASAFVKMQVGGTLLATALSVVAVWWGRLGAAGIFAGLALGWAIMLVPILRTVSAEGSLAPRAVRRPMIFEFLAFGLPMVPAGIATWALVLLDRFVIEFYRGTAEVGVYSVVHSLGDRLIQLVTAPILLAMFPSLMKSFELRGQQLTNHIQTQFVRYLAIFTFPLLAAAIICARPLVRLLCAPAYFEGWPVLAIVAGGSLISAFTQIAGLGLGLHKRTRLIMYNTLSGAAINLCLNIALVPRFGYIAAAWNFVIARVLLLGMTWWQSRRYMRMVLEWEALARILLASAGMAAVLFLVVFRASEGATRMESAWLLLLGHTIGLVTYAALLVWLKGIRPEEIELVRAAGRRLWARRSS